MAIFNKKDEERKRWAMVVGATYDNIAGRQVLKSMLLDSGVFSSLPLGDDEAVIKHNIALSILFDMGILNDENLDELIDNLLKMRYKE